MLSEVGLSFGQSHAAPDAAYRKRLDEEKATRTYFLRTRKFSALCWGVVFMFVF
jgi:hypothetical protein